MPNYVEITCSIIGKSHILGQFVEQARGIPREAPPQPFEKFPGYQKEPRKEEVFCFDRLVPLPDEYTTLPYDPYGYEMEHQTWGIKWGASQHEELVFIEVVATYRFTCPWSAPRRFFETLSSKWSDLFFVVSYGGEGPTLGRFVMLNGEYQSNVEGDYNACPEQPEEVENEDEWYETIYETWEQQYRNGHDDFVEQLVIEYGDKIGG